MIQRKNIQRWIKESLGEVKKISTPWRGSKTWEKIKERKDAKLKLGGTISE